MEHPYSLSDKLLCNLCVSGAFAGLYAMLGASGYLLERGQTCLVSSLKCFVAAPWEEKVH